MVPNRAAYFKEYYDKHKEEIRERHRNRYQLKRADILLKKHEQHCKPVGRPRKQ